MNSCDVVDLSYESPEDEIQVVGLNCSIPSYLEIDLTSGNIVPELVEFIKKCLRIENSKGMMRIIKRSLLKVYHEASPHYIKSPDFKKLLKRTSDLIDDFPRFKFSYIKLLCDKLRLHKKKKRIDLITLGPCVKKKTESSESANNKSRIEVIDLDETEDENNTYQNEIIISDEEKENEICDSNLLIELDRDIQIMDDRDIDNLIENNTLANNHRDRHESLNNNLPVQDIYMSNDAKIDNKNTEDRMLLVVKRVEQVPNENTDELKIKQIENEIANLKIRIEELDEMEVADDSVDSPYFRSELLKQKVVDLYEELCKLTNRQPVKRHEIRLTVKDGHPDGPARILENHLNNNLLSNGYPPFPTFDEVQKCVVIANLNCNLEWNSIKVFQEALSLFTQCGRALQKLRQQREWNNLLARVKAQYEDDPAEQDGNLLAKLEANNLIAVKNETDIIERYASLEHDTAKRQDDENALNENSSTSQKKDNSIRNTDSSDDSDSDSDIEWEDCDSILKDGHFKPISVKDEIKENSECELDSVTVKRECEVKNEDISKLLLDLGDDFTVTTKILDIDDPHLIVEISDSSDDEVL